MSKRHQIRQLALQMLYQLDARGEDDREQIEQSIHDAPHGDTTKREAIDLAHAAWRGRDTLDQAVAELAPDWPTHRQPPVDRAILRLAGFELAEGLTPTAVVIDEAVELAKEFGSERSGAFINGVLDKIAKQPHAKANPDTPKNQPLAIKINKENDQ